MNSEKNLNEDRGGGSELNDVLDMPRRVVLSRQRGWRMPPGAVKVDRSTKFGNPYVGDGPHDRERMARLFAEYCDRPEQAEFVAVVRAELRGKDLACWCPLDGPCHADVLLAVANAQS